MKKICFINIFEGESGGGEIYLKRLINALSETSNFQITLLTPDSQELESGINSNISVKVITGVQKNRKIRNFYRFCQTVNHINSILMQIDFDYLVFNGERCSYLAPFIKSQGRKVLIRHMLIDTPLKALISRISFLKAYIIVTISNFHKKNYEHYIKSCKSKVHVIYNSVDLNSFFVEKFPNFDIIKFIQVGSLQARKGVLDTLQAFKNVLKIYPNSILNIVGQGDLEISVRNFVKKYNLEKNVNLLGFRDDIFNLISESHVFVLPSYDEGLPLSILEAFACGRPVISTRIAGIPEVIDSDKNGFIVEPGDIYALEKKMLFYCGNKEEIIKMGILGRQKVEIIFGKDQWVNNWKNIFDIN